MNERKTGINRRRILSSAVSGGFAALPAPSIAQHSPKLNWRLVSAFPRSLGIIYGAARHFSRIVGEMTDKNFQIQVFASGEIVPGLGAFDAVAGGVIEIAQTSMYYHIEEDPAFAIFSAIPFGLNARQQNSWLYQAGGIEIANDILKKYNVYGMLAGNTGTQMGGWFRREVNSVSELQSTRMRIGGLAGKVFQKIGVATRQIAAENIYSAMQTGVIDAAEWIGPADDERLGLHRVAKYYYYPGFWEGGSTLHHLINLEKWSSLPKGYQAVLLNAASSTNIWLTSAYDVQNPAALKRLVASGTQLRPFSFEIMDACQKATNELMQDLASGRPDFKRAMEAMLSFRADQYEWWQAAEYNFDRYATHSRAE